MPSTTATETNIQMSLSASDTLEENTELNLFELWTNLQIGVDAHAVSVNGVAELVSGGEQAPSGRSDALLVSELLALI